MTDVTIVRIRPSVALLVPRVSENERPKRTTQRGGDSRSETASSMDLGRCQEVRSTPARARVLDCLISFLTARCTVPREGPGSPNTWERTAEASPFMEA